MAPYGGVMDHAPGFLKVVNEVRPKVKEVTVEQAKARLRENPKAVLVDVREDFEWQSGHAADAVHLGKGVLERDIEKKFPDPNTELIMYCGGGYRSVLPSHPAKVTSLLFLDFTQLLNLVEQAGLTRGTRFTALRPDLQMIRAVGLQSTSGEADSTAELLLQIQ